MEFLFKCPTQYLMIECNLSKKKKSTSFMFQKDMLPLIICGTKLSKWRVSSWLAISDTREKLS